MIMGVLVPLLVLVALVALSIVMGRAPVFIALMAAVPALAAVFSSFLITALVALVSVAAGALLAFVTSDEGTDASLLPLSALAVLAILAIIAARVRQGSPPAVEVPVERPFPPSLSAASMADTDEMTGLLNRRGAIRALGARNEESDRVVGFLDCDLFKNVNDEYGTDVGDEFLQAIAGRLRHSMPAHDTVARWDGDEFLVAMSADAASARPAFERVIGSISAHPVRTTAGSIPASISVGAAVWSAGQDLEDVIARAGRALYSAKGAGRGLVVLDEGVEDEPEAQA